jgi:hypothetical protein
MTLSRSSKSRFASKLDLTLAKTAALDKSLEKTSLSRFAREPRKHSFRLSRSKVRNRRIHLKF